MARLYLSITQHVNYMNRVRDFLREAGENTTCDHHSCAFGKWYYGEGGECIRKNANEKAILIWEEIGQLHEKFHEESLAAVNYKENNDESAFLEHESKMMKASTLLINKLMLLDEKIDSASNSCVNMPASSGNK
jgi:hypothetical protein